MDIERVNATLVKAIGQLHEEEIDQAIIGVIGESQSGDMMPLIRAWAKKLPRLGEWIYNKEWKNNVRWTVKPHKNGVFVRVEKRDKDMKPLKRSGDMETVLDVDALDGGEYRVYVRGRRGKPGHGSTPEKAAKLLDKAWKLWRDD